MRGAARRNDASVGSTRTARALCAARPPSMICDMIRRFAIARGTAVLAALVLAASCRRSDPPSQSPAADTVHIDGSNGVLPLVQALADAYRADVPSAAIVLGGGLGSRARLEALVAGRIDVAVASHGLDSAALARDGLEAHRIAITPVVIGVHAGVAVRGASEAQVCDLLAGRLTSWAPLGGGTEGVHPHMRPESEVDTEVVRAGLPCMRDGEKTPGVTVVTVEETADMARALAETPGGVGVTTATVVEQSGGRIRALALDGVEPTAANVADGRYRLTRASYLVTRAPHSAAVASFLAYVRGENGARVLAANGSVPAL